MGKEKEGKKGTDQQRTVRQGSIFAVLLPKSRNVNISQMKKTKTNCASVCVKKKQTKRGEVLRKMTVQGYFALLFFFFFWSPDCVLKAGRSLRHVWSYRITLRIFAGKTYSCPMQTFGPDPIPFMCGARTLGLWIWFGKTSLPARKFASSIKTQRLTCMRELAWRRANTLY